MRKRSNCSANPGDASTTAGGGRQGANFIFQSGSQLYRNCFRIRGGSALVEGGMPGGYAARRAEAEKWVGHQVYAQVLESSPPDWYNGHDRQATLVMDGFPG